MTKNSPTHKVALMILLEVAPAKHPEWGDYGSASVPRTLIRDLRAAMATDGFDLDKIDAENKRLRRPRRRPSTP